MKGQILIKERKISFKNSEEKFMGFSGNGFSNKKKLIKKKRLERVGEYVHWNIWKSSNYGLADVKKTSFSRLNWMAESFPSTAQSLDRVVEQRVVVHLLRVR